LEEDLVNQGIIWTEFMIDLTERPVDPEAERAWSNVIAQLNRITTLRDDWDGAGASPPSAEVVSAARRFAEWMHSMHWRVADRIVASPSGTIVFEWHDFGAYREAEVVSSELVEWMTICDGEEPVHHTTPLPGARRRRQTTNETQQMIVDVVPSPVAATTVDSALS
jgi:hypothetical protein